MTTFLAANSINVRDLTFHYRTGILPALKDLSVSIPVGQVVAIIGKSGIGKSTLLRVLAGIYQSGSGISSQIQGGVHFPNRKLEEIRGPGVISMMAQNPFLLNHLTLKENILLPCRLSKEPDEGFYDRILSILDLRGDEGLMPVEMSGGIKTRVAFARSIISNPTYLYMDEPFTSLDLIRRWSMYRALRELRSKPNYTTVLTTHDLWEATFLAGTILVLDKSVNGNTVVHTIENAPPPLDEMTVAECLHEVQPKVESIALILQSQSAA